MFVICAWCRKVIEGRSSQSPLKWEWGIDRECADMLKKKYRMITPLNSNDIETLIKFLAKRNPACFKEGDREGKKQCPQQNPRTEMTTRELP